MSFQRNFSIRRKSLVPKLSSASSENHLEFYQPMLASTRLVKTDPSFQTHHMTHAVLSSDPNNSELSKIVFGSAKNSPTSATSSYIKKSSRRKRLNEPSVKAMETQALETSRYYTSKRSISQKITANVTTQMSRCLGAVRSIRSTFVSFSGRKILRSERWRKSEKDFLKAYLKKFDTEEVEVLRQVYKELSARNPGAGIDKETFLEYFRLPGLWGERLFYRFDYKCLGFIDYEEFLVGIAVCCRGTKYERINVLFQIFDLNDDGLLQKGELVTMLSNLPDLDRYVRKQNIKEESPPSHLLGSRQIFTGQSALNRSFCNAQIQLWDKPEKNDPGVSRKFLPSEELRKASENNGPNPDFENDDDDDEDDEDDEEEQQEPSNHNAVNENHEGCSHEKKNSEIYPLPLSCHSFEEGALDAHSCDSGIALNATLEKQREGYCSKHKSDILKIESSWPEPLGGMKQRKTLRFRRSCLDAGVGVESRGHATTFQTEVASSNVSRNPWVQLSRCKGESFMATSTTADNAIDVEAFVDEIIEECEFSETDTLTFIEFKAWLEQNDVILAMFNECLHEEVWGLQGNALYRRSGYHELKLEGSRKEKKKKDVSPFLKAKSHDVERRKRGVIEVRPDNFYKIEKLFMVSVRCTLSTLLEGHEQRTQQRNGSTKSTLLPSSVTVKNAFTSTHSSQQTLQILSHQNSLGTHCPSLFSLNAGDSFTTSDLIYPRQTREILDTQLVEFIKAANPEVEVAKLQETLSIGRLDEKICLFTCPSCHLLLVVCPRCKRSVSSLQLFHGTIVVECGNCLEGVPYRFYNCWHCRWNFSKAADMIDQCAPLCEGFLYKIGRHSHKCKERYFILIDNLLYYYKRKEDTKPLGFFFLEGCFVKTIEEQGATHHQHRLTECTSHGTTNYFMKNPELLSQDHPPSIRCLGRQNKETRKTERLGCKNKTLWKLLYSRLLRISDTSVLKSNVLPFSLHGKYGFSITHGLGKIPSRIFYTNSLEEREHWLKALKLAMNQQSVDDFYHIDQVVGQGKFSVVYHAVTRDSRRHLEVAIKVIEKRKMSLHEHELLRSELSILRLLRHPHVINLRQIFSSPTHIYIVMEYVKGGELYDLLQKQHILPESHVNRIIFQLLSTIAYLHKCGIIHRDIKPENILLTDDSNDNADIKITDFGLSCICGPSEFVTQPCGTLAYVAPEVLTLHGYNHKVDVWSVGIVMYLLLRGRLPFPVTSTKYHPAMQPNLLNKPTHLNQSCAFRNPSPTQKSHVYPSAHYAELKFPGRIWDQVSSSAKDLLRKLLQPIPEKRVSALEALEHIWIKNPTAVITEAASDLNRLNSNVVGPIPLDCAYQGEYPKHPTDHELAAVMYNSSKTLQFENESSSSGCSNSQKKEMHSTAFEAATPSDFIPSSNYHSLSLTVNLNEPSANIQHKHNQSFDTESYSNVQNVIYTSHSTSSRLSKKRFLDVTATSFSGVPLTPPVL